MSTARIISGPGSLARSFARAKSWWAGYINDLEIGGFGVPWGPFGYQSGCTTEDVPREEAAQLGLHAPPPAPPAAPGFNSGLSASARGMDTETGKIVLESSLKPLKVPVLPNEIHKPEINEPNGKRGTTEANSLQSAVAHLGGDAGDAGAQSGDSRGKITVQQGEELAKWAEENGLILSPESWLGEVVTGCSEHDLWLRDGEYWKITRPGHFGWVVIAGDDGKPRSTEATPLEYLARWINANSYLGDKAVLRGVARTEYGVQIVVSHPYIEGTYPNRLHILDDMTARGFSLVPGFTMGANAPSFYRSVDSVAVFDASEDNFILSEGVPVPVDVITMVVSGKLEDQIKRLLRD